MTKGTITRIIVLVLALINQVLAAMGKSPIPLDDATIEQFISLLFTIIASFIAAWKNNSVTKEAIEADAYLNELRQHK